MELEIWKDIEGISGYQISNFGRVKSFKQSNGRILLGGIRSGYPSVFLNGKNFTIHRLVGFSFIENPKNKEQINHIVKERLILLQNYLKNK